MPDLGCISQFKTSSEPDWEEFEVDIRDFLDRLDLNCYSYVQVQKSPKLGLSNAVEFQANYEPEWVERYRERRYDQVDPVCYTARRARSPFSWGTKQFLADFPKQQRRVFSEGRDYGIHYGISIPVIGIDGSISVASFVGQDKGSLTDVIHKHGSKLHLAAHQICDYLAPLSAPTPDMDEILTLLTVRERECLLWVTQGLTSEEIADRVFVSVSTVNYHLGNAVRKLNARNRHHAALIAMAKGLA